MREEQVLQRFYQSLFAIPKRRADHIEINRMVLDKEGVLQGFKQAKEVPDFYLTSSVAKTEIMSRLRGWGMRPQENLIIKHFSPRSLSFDGLQLYLDNLESTQRFTPDLLVIDYPAKMQIPINEYRLNLGVLFDKLSGLAFDRNLALVAPHQVTRSGSEAQMVTSKHIAEDWSIIGIADVVLAYSSTRMEKQSKLGRLFVDVARDEADKFGVLMTQNYEIGQYCLESILLPSNYLTDLQPGKPRSNGKDASGEEE